MKTIENGPEISLQELERISASEQESKKEWIKHQVQTGQVYRCQDGTYDVAKRRSRLIDEILGLKIYPIELSLRAQAKGQSPTGHAGTWGGILHDGNQTWVGLDPQTLMTPYPEILEILHLALGAKKKVRVVDLGAAYGRMGLVLHAYYPEGQFIGHEFVEQRVDEGNRIFQMHGCENSYLEKVDLFSPEYKIPKADCFFIYDFGRVEHIRKILGQLETMAMRDTFTLVVRGETTRNLLEYSYPLFKNIYPVIHNGKYSIYRV